MAYKEKEKEKGEIEISIIYRTVDQLEHFLW